MDSVHSYPEGFFSFFREFRNNDSVHNAEVEAIDTQLRIGARRIS